MSFSHVPVVQIACTKLLSYYTMNIGKREPKECTFEIIQSVNDFENHIRVLQQKLPLRVLKFLCFHFFNCLHTLYWMGLSCCCSKNHNCSLKSALDNYLLSSINTSRQLCRVSPAILWQVLQFVSFFAIFCYEHWICYFLIKILGVHFY